MAQSKLSTFFNFVSNNKKCTVEPESDSGDSDTEEATSEKKQFQAGWLGQYSWLKYEGGKMFCKVCTDHGGDNAFTKGTDNFRTSTLRRHIGQYVKKKQKTEVSTEHTNILKRLRLKANMEAAATNAEEGALVALKLVYWLAKENITLNRSEKSAKDFLHCTAKVVRDSVTEKIAASPYISLLADESTDISVQKNLVVSAHVVDPVTLSPSTHFLADVALPGGKGHDIFHAMRELIEEKTIPKLKIMSLGSDGAAVMTGLGEGVTGYFLREINPMAFNIHCTAHILALCSSQAAQKVTFLKGFQQTLTNIFYFFKRSATRVDGLHRFQEILDKPKLRMKEVHEVRWMSIFEAIETVFRTLDSLITFFVGDKDPSSKGYALKLTEVDFVHTVYMMIDVLPVTVITKLCLLFQRKDLDLPLIPIAVKTCLSDLEELLLHPKSLNGRDTYTSLLDEHIQEEDGKKYFKGNHLLKGRLTIETIRRDFIQSLIDNLQKRFPEDDTNTLSAFGILGMRPVTFLAAEELHSWGNEKLEMLIDRYGTEQQRVPRKNYQEVTVVAPAIISPDETRQEWGQIKQLVVAEGYPRNTLSELWCLISQYHKDCFPNLLKLAMIALTARTHTVGLIPNWLTNDILKFRDEI